MHPRFRFPRPLLLLAGTLLLSLPAAADDEAVDAIPGDEADAQVEVLLGSDEDDWNEPAWIPSLNVGVGFYSQKIDTNVSNRDVFSLIINNSLQPVPLRGGEDDEAIAGPVIELGFELMGPPVEILPADPRFLVQAGFREGLFPKRTVGRARSTFDPARPLDQQRGQLQADVRALTEVHLRDYTHAGLGMAFQLPIDGMNIKFKPSLNWVRSEATVTLYTDEPSGQGGGQRLNRGFREEWIENGISPRIVLDAEVLREGPISVGFYAEFEAMYFFGDLHDQYCVRSGADTTRFPGVSPSVTSMKGTCPAPADTANPAGNYSQLDWDIERKPLSYYGGVGVRFSWMGFQ